MSEKTKGDLEKIVEREIKLEVPRTASDIKLQSVGAQLAEALRRIAEKNGGIPQTR